MDEKKMQKGTVLILNGAWMVVAALTADAIGIGVKPGFGWKQGPLLIAGPAVAFARRP